jgi:uncharacterized RDD family membrane protein YckC
MPRTLIDAEVEVETPENARLTFRLAGPGTRSGAYLLDLLIRAAAIYGLLLLVALLSPLASVSGLPIGVLLLGFFVLEWGYFFAFEAFWNGQTPGKRALGLRVVKVEGYAVGVHDAMLRNLLRVADALPVLYGVGLLAAAASRRFQRVGDLVAGTMVVRERREWRRGRPDVLRALAPLTVDEVGRPSERTLDAIETFARRMPALPAPRAREIAAILAGPLARRPGFRGTGSEDTSDPSRFLLRVLRTFEAPEGAYSAPSRSGPALRAVDRRFPPDRSA